MFGLSRKKAAYPGEVPAEAPPLVADAEDDVPATLLDSFRILEAATLVLDAIAHGLGEARSLARSAARPDGAAQRGLIASRYAFLKEEIERHAAEQAIGDGAQIALALGIEVEGQEDRLDARALPACDFKSADEARALAQSMDAAIRGVDENASRIREAAGNIADRIATMAAASRPRAQVAAPAAAAKPVSARSRRAA
jgi:hypothetical protein